MGLSIKERFDPTVGTAGTYAGMAQGYGPSSFEWSGFSPSEGTINQPGYMPDVFSQGTQGNYALGLNPSANTGNEFSGGYPAFAPSQWGTFDMPIQNPTIGFNNQPYVENFNAGFPTQMNPAYNIDNITQPSMVGPFGGYPGMSAAYPMGPLGNPNPFGSMFGGQGWASQTGREG